MQAKNAELEERDEKIKSMRKSVISMTVSFNLLLVYVYFSFFFFNLIFRFFQDVLDQKCQEVEDLRTKVCFFRNSNLYSLRQNQ